MNTYARVLAIGIVTCAGTGMVARSQEDARMSYAPPPPLVQEEPTYEDMVPFHSNLKPHGMWIQVAPFGFVWRPYVAMTNPAWRPYHDGGTWVWENNAWCWQSEYEWGLIPFHYGRWMLSKTIGWVWIPGREWSPGWVSWRHTPTEYQWAPLPVEESSFIAARVDSRNGLSFGFGFSLTEEHYVSVPRRNYGMAVRDSVPLFPVYSRSLAVACYRPQNVVVVSRPQPLIRCDNGHWNQRPIERFVPPPAGREHRQPPNIVRPPQSRPVARPVEPERRTEPGQSTTDRRTSRIQGIISRSRQ